MDKLLSHAMVILCILQSVHASWWYLGIASSYQSTLVDNIPRDTKKKCHTLSFLAPRQRALCSKSKKVLDIITEGASMGIEECQVQFKDRRWNCTTFNTTDVFGKVLEMESREKAYVYSISAAGVMHAITRACAEGTLDFCGCDHNIHKSKPEDDFTWGGCSHNVVYGDRFSREFVDAVEKKNEPPGLMNLWNNEAGRKTIRTNMRRVCKCHGVSGSCSTKICWQTMQSFREIGRLLKQKFDGASQMKVHKRKKRLVPLHKNQKKPKKDELVYLSQSPDYCEYNMEFGSLGTQGRQCNKTSVGINGCSLLCCGRGYVTYVRKVTTKCDCKFHWCCEVICKSCTSSVHFHYCK